MGNWKINKEKFTEKNVIASLPDCSEAWDLLRKFNFSIGFDFDNKHNKLRFSEFLYDYPKARK